MNTYHVYTEHMSPALNGSSALECFERSNAIEMRNGIMFDFYPGLPHIIKLRACYSTYSYRMLVSVYNEVKSS